MLVQFKKTLSSSLLVIGLIIINCSIINAQGYLHADGKNIVDGEGNNFIIRSIGTGNWMLQEGYMMKSTDAGINTQWQFRKKLIETIGEVKTDSFYNVWLYNHLTKRDVDSMKVWGFNAIRPALHYKLFTPPIEDEPISGEITWFDKGFTMLDSLVSWCSQNQMYVILDMHGAPGGQGKNADISDYDPSKPSLWESPLNQTKLVALWYKIAERYHDQPWVGGYDLINETNWDFENSGNQNGCNCNQNKPLQDIFERIIDTIRTVDNNHIVFVSGNCWGNNYNGMNNLASYDDNLVFTFHKYWNFNDQASIDWIIQKRNLLNIPLWMSESGENSNTWFTNAISLFEKNNIGWSWWPIKKGGINNVLNATVNADYTKLINYWKNGSPSMTEDEVFQAVLQWADNHKLENCFIHYDVIDALIRQVSSYEAIPFKKHTLGKEFFFVDYDLGRNNVAYFDTDTANYHGSTGNFTNWNAGWSYRNDGVDIERCQDIVDKTNGFNVGWTADGEWLQYSLTTDSTAAYTLAIRHASGGGGSKFYFEVDGINISGTLQLPGTGGWQSWQTTTFSNLILPGGDIKLKFVFVQGGSNLNYFNFSNPTSIDSVDFAFVSAETSTDGYEIYVALNKAITTADADISLNEFELLVDMKPVTIISAITQTPPSKLLLLKHQENIYSSNSITLSYSGTSVLSGTESLTPFANKIVKNNLPKSHVIPGRIQAEDFYVNKGLLWESCSDIGGGLNSSYANPGDYLEYNVHVTSTNYYNLSYRIATIYNNAELILLTGQNDNFTPIHTIKFSSTGGWQTWQTQSSVVYLNQGYYQIRLLVKQGEHNLNWFEFAIATEIKELEGQRQINLHPNPANNYVILTINNPTGANSKVAVYNISGKIVKHFITSENELLIETNSFPKGVYFVRVQNLTGNSTKKLVIQ
jgi:endoglucanase